MDYCPLDWPYFRTGRDQVTESMGGRRRTVQVPVDGLLSTGRARRRVRRGTGSVRANFTTGTPRRPSTGALATGAFALHEGQDRRPRLWSGCRCRGTRASVRLCREGDDRHVPRRPPATDRGQAGARRARSPRGAVLVCAAEPERWLDAKCQDAGDGRGLWTFDWLVTHWHAGRSSHERLRRGVSPTSSGISPTPSAPGSKEDFRDLDAVDRA